MKNTRKKMLLSSVAMLLVALVALGSATYAWFTINKVVTADTMKVKAAAADGLVISNTKAADWKPAVSFDENKTSILTPVSYPIAVGSAMPDGYIAKDVKTSGAWASAADNSKVSAFVTAPALPTTYASGAYKFSETTNVARYDVDVASSGDAINKAVSASISATGSDKTFVKAALVTGGKVVAFYTDGVAYSAIKSTDPEIQAAPAATGTVQVMDSVPEQDNATAFQLYVWYEGNDPQCLDAALDPNNTDVSFKLTFTLAD